MIKYKELLFLNKINRVGKVTIYTKYWDMLINSKDMDDSCPMRAWIVWDATPCSDKFVAKKALMPWIWISSNPQRSPICFTVFPMEAFPILVYGYLDLQNK